MRMRSTFFRKKCGTKRGDISQGNLKIRLEGTGEKGYTVLCTGAFVRGGFVEWSVHGMDGEKKKKGTPVTIALVAVNVAIFVIVDLFLFRRQDEIAYYMALNPRLVFKEKEYWRIVTSMFYHFGTKHLVCNMLMLFFVGRLLEPVFGSLRLFVLYFVSGLVASGASLLYNGIIIRDRSPFVFSAGASGAIYGLVGAFAVFFFIHRARFSVDERRRAVLALVLVLFGSIFDTGVGHAAHFGGFFAGIVIGMVYCLQRKRQQQNKEKQIHKQ